MHSSTIKLLSSSKTIFNTQDLALLWQEKQPSRLHAKINHHVAQGTLTRLSRGVFSKVADYDRRELATSIYRPAYISCETVLRDEGVIFQHHPAIYVVSKWSRVVDIDQQQFVFRKIKDPVLFDKTGIIDLESYSIASKERAFLDALYLLPNFYFDNPHSLDWQLCAQIVPIYQNKQLIRRLAWYQKKYAQ